MDAFAFKWVILPILIFLIRICDMSLGTMRIIFLYRGEKVISALLGFFEVLIWLLAIRQVFGNLSNIACFFAYAGGFSMGTFVGILIEQKLAIGVQVLKVITSKDADALCSYLTESGYGFTCVDGYGARGKVNLVYSIVKRGEMKKLINIIKKFNPKAFYTIEDIKSISSGIGVIDKKKLLKFFARKKMK